ncbi:site-specific integrase [Paenibacillus melissococcoides]|uniref:Site-specific integrase n=1 Tax=Paenibacillus melissococcoides TaxID=2912268 RepID=A0ABM9GC88_9BACL|nr:MULTISPECIES: site-specific integrase [Paenibacillus]MEB9894174.1 site-specific integrase [Bacillus cereus]GIO79483.1 site-specific integrase [Paenibacillus dendritiformis]CAH8249753.1 site-specific integrase [Paenibacillus melissococcoides]CAH8721805.1 site-specific integrase [Paenibacillus melissococcoides]
MASFQKYKTKDGWKWMYKYYSSIDPLTGKKKPSTKRGFDTKKQAQLHAAQTEQDIANGTFIEDSKNPTFEAVYKQWYATHSLTLKPPSRRAVRSKFKQQILPHFGKLKMKDITKPYCQEVVNKIAEKIKSVDNMRMYANQVFDYAIKMDIIQANPMAHAVIPRKDTEFDAEAVELAEKRDYWEKHEIKQFLNILKKDYPLMDYVMFHLLIYTGARKGEVLALHESDIDSKNKTLTLNKTLYQENNVYTFQTPKTASSRRSISLDEVTFKLLKKWITSEKKRFLELGQKWNDKQLLFTRQDGTPLRLAYPNDKLKEIIRKHNIHPITVHGLRHTHASLLFEAGASIKEVQERLGHSNSKMTMDIYTHLTKTVKERTATLFGEFMRS